MTAQAVVIAPRPCGSTLTVMYILCTSKGRPHATSHELVSIAPGASLTVAVPSGLLAPVMKLRLGIGSRNVAALSGDAAGRLGRGARAGRVRLRGRLGAGASARQWRRLGWRTPPRLTRRRMWLQQLSCTITLRSGVPPRISGTAKVYGIALVGDHARVSGDARVGGNAQVGGDAQVPVIR